MWTGPRHSTLKLTTGPSWRQSRCRLRRRSGGLPVVACPGGSARTRGKSKNFGLYCRCRPSRLARPIDSSVAQITPSASLRSWTCRRAPRPAPLPLTRILKVGRLAARDGRAGLGRDDRVDAAGGGRGARRATSSRRRDAENGSEGVIDANRNRHDPRPWHGFSSRRDLPFPALDRLRAEHEVDVWEERTPPPPRRAARARAAGRRAADDRSPSRSTASCFDAAPSRQGGRQPRRRHRQHRPRRGGQERGIPVGNTPGVLTDATADIAFALLLGDRAPDHRGRARGARGRAGRRGTRRTCSAATSPTRRSGSSAGAASGRRWRAAARASG